MFVSISDCLCVCLFLCSLPSFPPSLLPSLLQGRTAQSRDPLALAPELGGSLVGLFGLFGLFGWLVGSFAWVVGWLVGWVGGRWSVFENAENDANGAKVGCLVVWFVCLFRCSVG